MLGLPTKRWINSKKQSRCKCKGNRDPAGEWQNAGIHDPVDGCLELVRTAKEW